uniref:Reverse transcriptase zinc-binding domain-containing protein n=1 Tax=Cannabis sativa TaxID=3483 RepID=A0A803QIM0_CANSA
MTNNVMLNQAAKGNKFKVSKFYVDLIGAAKSSYATSIWHKFIVPKHRFIFWQIINEQLLTRDLLSKFLPITSALCVVCENAMESHNHLFIDCIFTKKVIACVESWAGVLSWPKYFSELQQRCFPAKPDFAEQSFNWKGFPDKKVSDFIKQCEKYFGENTLKKIDFTINGGELVVGETSGVEGYNLEHPDFPPPTSDAPLAESEDRICPVAYDWFAGRMSVFDGMESLLPLSVKSTIVSRSSLRGFAPIMVATKALMYLDHEEFGFFFCDTPQKRH